MTPQQHELLRAGLERATDRFFQKLAQPKGIIAANGSWPVEFDATGLMVVLAQWVGDLIAGAPEHMRDDLFMRFADTVVTVAGIKAEDEDVAQTIQ